jgi:peptidyl-prolyl cis-trans isomerase A (cyclophilin A)
MKMILVSALSAFLLVGCTAPSAGNKNSSNSAALRDPSKAIETAPDVFKVKFSTTKGDFTAEFTRAWSPNGVDRVYNLVKAGYYTDIAVFRNVEGFMAQFGISGDPELNTIWRVARIQDDPVVQSNVRGNITFAMGGKNSRTTQMFINHGDNTNLDGMGFSPVGKVISGMEVVDALNNEYGDGPPNGRGPNQGMLQKQGNAYLKASFPNLDYIKSAAIE